MCIRDRTIVRIAAQWFTWSSGGRMSDHSGGVSSFTAWRPLVSPSGEAAFGPCSPPLAAARNSSGHDPAARLAAGSLAVLLPRVEPLGRSQRLPAARRALGPRGLRSDSRFTRGADGMPPTHHSDVVLRSRVLAKPKA